MASRLSYSVRTHRGAREENQDAWLVWPRRLPLDAYLPLVIGGVFDGMGGHFGGKKAGRLAAGAAAGALDSLEGEPPARRLRAALEAAQAAVVAGRLADCRYAEMAATFIAAATDGRDLQILWLGDSPGFLIRNGRVRRLTTDHVIESPAGPLITQYLGAPEVEPGECELQVHPGDRVLLCSDGVIETLDEDELADFVSGETAVDGVRGLILESRRRGVSDNATAVVLAIGDPPIGAFRRAWRVLGEAIGWCKS
jgi:serine/threonine protein phosphatase PrpC